VPEPTGRCTLADVLTSAWVNDPDTCTRLEVATTIKSFSAFADRSCDVCLAAFVTLNLANCRAFGAARIQLTLHTRRRLLLT
jgi:hypothetical protein